MSAALVSMSLALLELLLSCLSRSSAAGDPDISFGLSVQQPRI